MAQTTGSTTNVRTVDEIRPPTMTTAKGRAVSAPTACESAAGSRPSAAMPLVISTGRRAGDRAFGHGGKHVVALVLEFADALQEDDAVLHARAKQGDEAHQSRHAGGQTGDGQRHHPADGRQRDVEQDDRRQRARCGTP